MKQRYFTGIKISKNLTPKKRNQERIYIITILKWNDSIYNIHHLRY